MNYVNDDSELRSKEREPSTATTDLLRRNAERERAELYRISQEIK